MVCVDSQFHEKKNETRETNHFKVYQQMANIETTLPPILMMCEVWVNDNIHICAA